MHPCLTPPATRPPHAAAAKSKKTPGSAAAGKPKVKQVCGREAARLRGLQDQRAPAAPRPPLHPLTMCEPVPALPAWQEPASENPSQKKPAAKAQQSKAAVSVQSEGREAKRGAEEKGKEVGKAAHGKGAKASSEVAAKAVRVKKEYDLPGQVRGGGEGWAAPCRCAAPAPELGNASSCP